MILSIIFSLLSLGFSGTTQATAPAPLQLYISKDSGESWQDFTQGLPEGSSLYRRLQSAG